ncbi:MAG: nickel-binding protein [Chloroflexota bacterium]
MPTYLVEHDLPGLSRDQFRAAQRALQEAASTATARGSAVRFLRGVFVPAEGRAVCLYEAADAEDVRTVNRAVGVSFSTVVDEVVDIATDADYVLPDSNLNTWR